MRINFTKTVLPVGLLALGTCALLTSNYTESKSEYKPRTEMSDPGLANEASEYYKSIYANIHTGQIEKGDHEFAFEQFKTILAQRKNRVAGLEWIEEGPDNVGGRTRAICVDPSNHNVVWAGSVSGGLYKSLDGGGWWSRVTSFDLTISGGSSLGISSICKTASGRIYVATGSSFESGIFGYNSGQSRTMGIVYSDDNGANWAQLSTTPVISSFNVNEVIADPIVADRIWVGANRLYTYDPTNGLVQKSTTIGSVNAFDISEDGQVIIVNSGANTYVSEDGATTFTLVTGTGATQISSNNTRIEYAISFEKNSNGKYNIFAGCSKSSGAPAPATNKWEGYISNDNGATWSKTVPGGGSLNPVGTQGGYNNIVAPAPGNNGRFVIGGIDCYRWDMDPDNSTDGQVEQISFWFLPEPNPFLIHADNHEMQWDRVTKQLYVGNDGGVYKSFDENLNFFYSANRGYNVTQFYSVGYSGHNDVMGGTQDNGTQLNDHTLSFYQSFKEVMGGDGWDCDISQIDPKVMIGTLYYGGFMRSNNGGQSMASIISGRLTKYYGTSPSVGPGTTAGDFGTFHTVGRLYENENDNNSTDTLTIVNNTNDTIYSGQTVTIYFKHRSYGLDDSITITATQNYAPLDSMTYFVDKVQTLYAIGLKGGAVSSNFNAATGTGENGVWITRNVCDFGANPVWDSIPGIGAEIGTAASVYCIEFSRDGNYMYVGTSSGELIRVSGLNTYYGGTGGNSLAGVTSTRIRTYTGPVMGIGIDHNNPDHLVIALGGGGGTDRVQSISNATTATLGAATTTDIHSTSLPSMPILDAVVDVNDPTGNTVVLGTEFGVWSTDDGGLTWAYESGGVAGASGPGPVPVFAVRQQSRPWGTYTSNPGMIFIGTHGRGIWRSATLVGFGNNPATEAKDIKPLLNLSIYPNPAVDLATLEFTLNVDASDALITVHNLSGKMVYSENIEKANKGKNQTTLDVSGLAKGTYLVSINAAGKRFTNKLVVR